MNASFRLVRQEAFTKGSKIVRKDVYKKMEKSYYHTCPICGANLDPGETCDCMSEQIKKRLTKFKKMEDDGVIDRPTRLVMESSIYGMLGSKVLQEPYAAISIDESLPTDLSIIPLNAIRTLFGIEPIEDPMIVRLGKLYANQTAQSVSPASDLLTIGFDYSKNSDDHTCLTIGRIKDGSISVLNTFYDEEAIDLYHKLINSKPQKTSFAEEEINSVD